MPPKPPILRFAPSPTGSLHLGGLRTALYNHLFARKNGGKWILRIEDTDTQRFVQGAVDNIRKSLEWAGLEYDFGPGVGGPHATYFQSERLDLYRYYANKLIEKGHAYHCFCSPQHLSEIKEKLAKRGSNATYDKTCLHLSEEEVARKKRAGESYVVRLNDSSPPSRIAPVDIVFGTLKDAHNSLPTDPILCKTDGFPTYHLASVVDDHDMGVTHVLRGEEWLPSLPLHLDLYSCFGFEPPEFAHLPLLLNPDGSKMSKRKGDVAVSDYIEKGWTSAAVLNWLALAGWGASHTKGKEALRHEAPESTEMLTLMDLIDRFDVTYLTPRRTILDPKKLEVLNGRHLQRLIETDTEGMSKLARSVIMSSYGQESSSEILDKINFDELLISIKDRLKNINELTPLLQFLFTPVDMTQLGRIDKGGLRRFIEVISKYESAIEPVTVPWNEATIRRIEALREARDELQILRQALTWQKTGLPLLIVMKLLGRDETLRRLSEARQFAVSEIESRPLSES